MDSEMGDRAGRCEQVSGRRSMNKWCAPKRWLRAVARDGSVTALVLIASCGTNNTISRGPLPALTPEPITAPVTDDSVTLQLTSAGGRTIASWIEATSSGTTLKFAERTTSGWSEPVAVVSG